MKALMRSYVYWLNMDQDIEKLVKACRGCALAAKAPPVKIQPWPNTWLRLHIDFAGLLNGEYYLIDVDNYTKWPEICKCGKAASKVTMEFLDELFVQYGIPDTIVSDNETQFTSKEFKNFCKMHAMEHITTPPFHPRLAERFVERCKNLEISY
eukprot:XP_014780156.1 PREDICTED: uncharacterized protein K02A2.6-like [Octopus bimaculoides]